MKISAYWGVCSIAVLTVGLASGCQKDEVDSAAGAGAGGTTNNDAAGGSGGTGVGAASGGSIGQGGADAGSCADLADAALADDCDSGRKCNYEGFKGLCESGNVAATSAFLGCMRSSGGCHTPADPGSSSAESCFGQALDDHGTPEAASARLAAVNLCPDKVWAPAMIEIVAVAAGTTAAAAIRDCVRLATDCDAAMACTWTVQGGLDLPESCQ